MNLYKFNILNDMFKRTELNTSICPAALQLTLLLKPKLLHGAPPYSLALNGVATKQLDGYLVSFLSELVQVYLVGALKNVLIKGLKEEKK